MLFKKIEVGDSNWMDLKKTFLISGNLKRSCLRIWL